LFEDCYCGIGERHAMLAAALHPIGGHGPHSGLEVYLVPLSADHLAGSRGGQDRKLQRLRRNAGPFPKVRDELCEISA
jgi:hypothetical protein